MSALPGLYWGGKRWGEEAEERCLLTISLKPERIIGPITFRLGVVA